LTAGAIEQTQCHCANIPPLEANFSTIGDYLQILPGVGNFLPSGKNLTLGSAQC
jgi:hypothetical protein